NLGSFLGYPAVDFPVEVLDDLRTPLLQPYVRGRDLLAALQHQRVWQLRVRVGLGLVVVGSVRGLRIAAVGSGPELIDLQEFHQPLMVLLGGHLYRRWRLVGIGLLWRVVPARRGDNGQRQKNEAR